MIHPRTVVSRLQSTADYNDCSHSFFSIAHNLFTKLGLSIFFIIVLDAIDGQKKTYNMTAYNILDAKTYKINTVNLVQKILYDFPFGSSDTSFV